MHNRFIVFISLFFILSSGFALCSDILNYDKPENVNTIKTIRQFDNLDLLKIAKRYEKVLVVYSIDSIIEYTNGVPKLRDKEIPKILQMMNTTLTKECNMVTFIIMNTKPALQYTDTLISTQLKDLKIDNKLFTKFLYSYQNNQNKWISSFGKEYSKKATSKQLIEEFLQKNNTPEFDLACCTSHNETTAKQVQKAFKVSHPWFNCGVRILWGFLSFFQITTQGLILEYDMINYTRDVENLEGLLYLLCCSFIMTCTAC